MRNTPGDRMNDWFWGELSLLMVLAEAEMWSLSMTVAWGFHNLVCWTGIAWWALIKSPVWGIWNEQLWWWRVCQKAFMQIKLLLEKQNASYTNSLGWEQENTESTAACGVDAGAYWEFSTLQCRWDGFFFFSLSACVKAANAWLIINQYSAAWDAQGCTRPGAFEASATVKASRKSFCRRCHTAYI